MSDTTTNQNVPYYVIYCDESCHELNAHHTFMAIGGLTVLQAKKLEFTKSLRQIMNSHNLNSELKWSKVSSKRLEGYKTVVDFFFANPEICFRSIVVDQTKVQLARHGKDKELAFYKFYYEMLEKWLLPGNEYLILLDHKSNKYSNRYTTLKTYLERHLRGKAWIRDLTTISSKITPLAQLCDILTGAVAAANNGFNKGSAKQQLAEHIQRSAKLTSLCSSTPLSENKFNIFKMDLR